MSSPGLETTKVIHGPLKMKENCINCVIKDGLPIKTGVNKRGNVADALINYSTIESKDFKENLP